MMIDLHRISHAHLETEPFRCAVVDPLFSQADAAELAETFPSDHFKRLADYGGEKDFQYEARALLGMGERSISRPRYLSRAWQQLAADFLSPEYRAAMSALTGCDLGAVPVEVNVFHYPPGGELGAHTDLRDKIVTHVLYFNESWDDEDGGCLTILRSSNPRDVARVVSPLVGNSAVIVRSANSWHAVSPVVKTCRLSRRSLTATFYHPGSVSTMWPPGDATPLHNYPPTPWDRWKNRLLRRHA